MTISQRRLLPLFVLALLSACGPSRQEMESKVLEVAARSDVSELRRYLKKDKTIAAFADSKNMGRTPLHAVTTKEAAELLLDAGADPKALDDHLWTPLHLAAGGGIAELLIEKGADVQAKTATMLAPIQTVPSGEAVEVLLRKGASVEVGRADSAPVVLALREKRLDAARALLEKSSFDFNTPFGFNRDTLLHEAAAKGDKEVVSLLLAKGAQVDAKNSAGATPLHLAVLNDRVDVAELLIAGGADIHAELSAFAAVQDNLPRVGPMPANYGAAGRKKPIQLAKSDAMKELLKSKGATE